MLGAAMQQSVWGFREAAEIIRENRKTPSS
jgi:hypothetical protein